MGYFPLSYLLFNIFHLMFSSWMMTGKLGAPVIITVIPSVQFVVRCQDNSRASSPCLSTWAFRWSVVGRRRRLLTAPRIMDQLKWGFSSEPICPQHLRVPVTVSGREAGCSQRIAGGSAQHHDERHRQTLVVSRPAARPAVLGRGLEARPEERGERSRWGFMSKYLWGYAFKNVARLILLLMIRCGFILFRWFIDQKIITIKNR